MALRKAKPREFIKQKRKPLTRSEVMRAVKSKDTQPELKVRAHLKAVKIKFKTYANLPGRPDMVLNQSRTAIRVMGCFWHGHSCKNGNRVPKSNIEYWVAKIKRNVARDKENKRDLKKLGWQVIDIWECQLRKSNWGLKLVNKLGAFQKTRSRNF